MSIKQTSLMFVVFSIVVLNGCANMSNRNNLPLQSQSMSRSVLMEIDYLVYLPKDYGRQDKQWPLIIHKKGKMGH